MRGRRDEEVKERGQNAGIKWGSHGDVHNITFYTILIYLTLTTVDGGHVNSPSERLPTGGGSGGLDGLSLGGDNSLRLQGDAHIDELERSNRMKRSFSDSMRMPGTNWCGRGWRAREFNSLGRYAGADKCCRQHDLGCEFQIGPLETKYGIYNWRMYPSMHCTCDERFRSCLKMANSAAANMVGHVFFNVIRTPCFLFSTRRVCAEETWWGKCLREELQPIAEWRLPMNY